MPDSPGRGGEPAYSRRSLAVGISGDRQPGVGYPTVLTEPVAEAVVPRQKSRTTLVGLEGALTCAPSETS